MKSAGEVMALGRTFKESLQRHCASRRLVSVLLPRAHDGSGEALEDIRHHLGVPERALILFIGEAFDLIEPRAYRRLDRMIVGFNQVEALIEAETALTARHSMI